MRKLTLADMHKMASERKGKCMSTEYINSGIKLSWQCSKGHMFESTQEDVKQGHWCPTCAGVKKSNIVEMIKVAEKLGGKCLSTKYTNARTRLTWQCSNGHIWNSAPDSVKQGHWCPQCNKGKLGNNLIGSIEEMQELAKSKGGRCISAKYVNSATKLTWECTSGHVWDATPSTIKSGHWCHICAGNTKCTIEDMRELAQKNGGDCFSLIYINDNTKLSWGCANGHIWDAVPSSVKQGHWCPQCSSFYSEEKCRFIIEYLTGKRFSKSRLALGNNTELDGYNEELKFGFEYNGIQHYHKTGFFHKSETDLTKRIFDDAEKEQVCKDRGIKLLVIPYTEASNLLDYISLGLEELSIPIITTKDSLSFDTFYASISNLNEYKDIAEKRGGKLLSSEYIGTRTKLKWQCSEGHIWKATPGNTFRGHWCPYCAGKAKKTLGEMKELAKNKGGECLSDVYKNSKTKLKWQCSEGHIWEATPDGHWCPYCAGKVRKTIEDMKEFAKSKGGECLSDIYENNKTKLKWQCSKGHIWEAVQSDILGGHWCPYCAGKVRKTIEDMKEFAKSKGGECLSDTYINSSTKLKWQCSGGHIWEAIHSNIFRGAWCPYCAGKVKKTLEEMKEFAKSKGGECLSDVYENNSTKLKWQCSEGHIWEAIPRSTFKGHWCPYCAGKTKKTLEGMN